MQSWIDIFGARMSKAGGSLVTNAFSASIPGLINVGGSVAAAGAGFLIWVAWMMGKKFDELIETGEVVGGDPEVGNRKQNDGSKGGLTAVFRPNLLLFLRLCMFSGVCQNDFFVGWEDAPECVVGVSLGMFVLILMYCLVRLRIFR